MKLQNLLNVKLRQWFVTAIVIMLLPCLTPVNAQVLFTHTTTDDFNKGQYVDMNVTSNTVSIPFQATGMNNWVTTTVLPQSLAGHKVASFNNRYFYVVGGNNGVSNTATVYRATAQTTGVGTWTALTSLPVAVRDHAVVTGTNRIYVLGGRDGSTIYNTIYTASLGLTGGLGTWIISTVNLPENLWGHTAVYCNGYIYVAGGSINTSPTSARSNVYYAKVNQDNTLSAFTAATSLPQPLNGHTMVANGNEIFIIGGFTSGGTKVNTVYKATSANDGSLGAWALETAIPEAVSNHASVIINGIVTVTGGENSSTLINKTYYADVNQTPLTWITGTDKYEYTKDGIAYANNGQLIYSGGEDLSGSPIHNSRYAPFSLSANRKLKGQFISNSYIELGAERYITELILNSTIVSGAAIQVSYRLAGDDKIWSNWSAPVSGNNIPVADSSRYLQYKVDYTSNGTANATMNTMSLSTPGTQLAGSLNAIPTFTKAASPYWVTDNITFTAGTHTFEAGTVLLFLPQKTMTVGAANIICNGNATDSVYFTGYTDEQGLWGGIYFNSSSSGGVSSQFYYTVISNAGYGTYASNIYCDGTSEPLLNNCNIFGSTADGVRLKNAHINIQSSKIHNNATNGVSLTTSNPIFINTQIYNNAAAGVYLTATTSNPTYTGTSITGNLYAIHYGDPNSNFYQPNGSPTLSGNTYNGLVLSAGNINGADRLWSYITYDYILLGALNIIQYNSRVRLTIEPGNTIKGLSDAYIQVGGSFSGGHGGELYAIGTVDSMITFTSWNGASGGWKGIFFHTYSDSYGSQPSVLDYCIVENGNDYNIFADGTNIQVMNSIVRNATKDGIRFSTSSGTIFKNQIQNCSENGLTINQCSPSISKNNFLNNGLYPLNYLSPNCNPVLDSNTYTGNAINYIAISGGMYSEDQTFYNDGIPYHILDDINIARYNDKRTLTLQPGITLAFNPGKKLQIGGSFSGGHGGNLFAQGTSVKPVTFKAYNDTPGGWAGILFTTYSDSYGSSSVMEHCIVEQANTYNVYCESTNTPNFENCIFRNAATDGLRLNSSSMLIKKCGFFDNGAYPLKLLNLDSDPVLDSNIYIGNSINYISLPGGTISNHRTIYNDNVPYHVSADLTLASYQSTRTLTIQPGVTMCFDTGTRFIIGPSSYGGNLYAVGTPAEYITFKSFADTTGGWEGIRFESSSDSYGSYSLMKYCIVEQGLLRNVLAESTNQPAIKNCILRNSASIGLRLINAALDTVYNTTITDNVNQGVYISGTSGLTLGNDTLHTCNIFNNGSTYQIYNLSPNHINARYNYWGTNDSTMIAQSIFDKYDSTAMGIVYFMDFATVPAIPSDTIEMSGSLKYANTAETPLDNAAMVVHSFGMVPYASTTTNVQGIYNFNPIPSGNYQLSATPAAGWGGVNATDALIILNHFSQIDTLTGMEYAAADVNASATINATDAMFVLKRFATVINSFPAGDYLQHTESVTVNGSEVINHIKMLCFGDVNASYVPTNPKSTGINLVSESTLTLPSFTEFDLPVRVKSGISAGAVSLGFYFPEQYLEILDVSMPDGNSNFYYTAQNGIVKIAWCHTTPISVDADSVLLTLRIRTGDLSNLTNPINLIIYEQSELADAYAQVMQGVTLEIPEIQGTATVINELNSANALTCYPNPVSGQAVITYNITESVPLTLTLYNALGAHIQTIFAGNADSGTHRFDFNANQLGKGIYFLKLESALGNSVLKVIAID